VSYPTDGQPNLRAGWEAIPLVSAARFQPTLILDELWEDFCAGSASIITDGTDTLYRYDWGLFRTWLTEADIPPILKGPQAADPEVPGQAVVPGFPESGCSMRVLPNCRDRV
jgi:hypothetical protein